MGEEYKVEEHTLRSGLYPFYKVLVEEDGTILALKYVNIDVSEIYRGAYDSDKLLRYQKNGGLSPGSVLGLLDASADVDEHDVLYRMAKKDDEIEILFGLSIEWFVEVEKKEVGDEVVLGAFESGMTLDSLCEQYGLKYNDE